MRTSGACPRATFTTAQAIKWEGNLDLGDHVPDPSQNCSLSPFSRYLYPYGPDAALTKRTGNGETIKAAVSLPLFGSLSATTSFSRFSELDWNSGSRYRHYYLCGNTDVPLSAQAIYAGREVKK